MRASKCRMPASQSVLRAPSGRMLRIATIAYLSLTTVLGPAVCCCTTLAMFSARDTSACCDKSASGNRHATHGHGGDHGHRHHGHATSSSKVAPPTEDKPTPNGHDSHDCPCGEHQPSLVGAAIAD